MGTETLPKPESTLVLFNVRVPFVIFNKPEPLSVPFNVMLFAILGLFPSGKLQLLFTVFTPVLLNVTKLNATLLQLRVAVDPPKLIVPELLLNVGEPEIVNAPLTVVVPEAALKVPPEIVNEVVVALLGKNKEPLLMLILEEVTKLAKELKSAAAPLIFKLATSKLLNPDNVPPELSFKVELPPKVIVPVPINEELVKSKILPPLVNVGLLPTGKLQLVMKISPLVLVIVTRLKVALLHA